MGTSEGNYRALPLKRSSVIPLCLAVLLDLLSRTASLAETSSYQGGGPLGPIDWINESSHRNGFPELREWNDPEPTLDFNDGTAIPFGTSADTFSNATSDIDLELAHVPEPSGWSIWELAAWDYSDHTPEETPFQLNGCLKALNCQELNNWAVELYSFSHRNNL